MPTVDLTIMDDFDTSLYGWGGMRANLTDRQRLQLEIARVLNTSVSDAKHNVAGMSDDGLRHALALAKHRELKTLTKMLEVETRKRGGDFIQEKSHERKIR